jgi:hypothetical protein
MELSILCANLPILTPLLGNLMSGHNGIHMTTVDNSSRQSRNVSTRGRSRRNPPTNLAQTLDLCQADAESDHSSQKGILRTTTIKVNHDMAKVQALTPNSHRHVEEHYMW